MVLRNGNYVEMGFDSITLYALFRYSSCIISAYEAKFTVEKRVASREIKYFNVP